MPSKQVSIDTLPKEDHFWMLRTSSRKKTPKRKFKSLAEACIGADKFVEKTGKRVFILEGIGCVIPEEKKE